MRLITNKYFHRLTALNNTYTLLLKIIIWLTSFLQEQEIHGYNPLCYLQIKINVFYFIIRKHSFTIVVI